MRFRPNLWLGLALLGLVGVGLRCATAPYTGRRQLILLAEAEERRLGEEAYRELLQQKRLSRDPRKVAWVRRVGERIARAAHRPDYRWAFAVIEDDHTVNAFCLPGGKIAVYTGILPLARDDAGLATVLAHEVAHALLRHGAERMSTGFVAELVRLGLLRATGAYRDPEKRRALSLAYGVGVGVGMMLPFSRTQELEADRVGLLLMARAGYDPREALAFWERMMRHNRGAQVPEFLSTHPSDQHRLEALRRY
ncbi:MAG: M48 family metallopeptidase, partial [Candidatus Hydrothermae bacterium]|nr:M48 family metallopeptidase [Candidatus Hydrothermae bacterium]